METNTMLKAGGITAGGAALGALVAHFMKKKKLKGAIIGGLAGAVAAYFCCKGESTSGFVLTGNKAGVAREQTKMCKHTNSFGQTECVPALKSANCQTC